ncbi:MAG: TonB-dependent receptor [Halochromatium sp.]
MTRPHFLDPCPPRPVRCLVSRPAPPPTAALSSLCCCGLLALLPGLAGADPMEIVLDEIQVSGRLVTPTRQAAETVYTGLAVTREGIEAGGARASMQVSEAIDLLPGVSAQQPDKRGLGVEQSTVRLRGVNSRLGALTIEGVPNYGGNPIGPRDYLYDMENFDAISVYLGGTPADLGAGVGTRGGAIVLHPRWPDLVPGAEFAQTIGSHAFQRTRVRLESGALGPAETRLSAAYSYSDADKWRGPGTLGPRHNLNLALAQEEAFGTPLQVRLWYNENRQAQHLYRALTFAETHDLGRTFKRDFNAEPTGQPAQDIDYFDYNRSRLANRDLLALIDYRPNAALHLSLKPYWSGEDSRIWQGTASGGGRVQKRLRDINRWGLIADGSLDLGAAIGRVGLHYEHSDMDVSTQNFGIVPAGLAWRGAGVVATTGATEILSPYVTLSGSQGRLSWQGGLKYFHFRDSDTTGFTSGPGPDYALLRAPDLDRPSTRYAIWLPTLGLSWDLDARTQLYTSYGRSFIRPYAFMPLVNVYDTNRAAFQAGGVTLADLFDGRAIEQSDSLDLGLRFVSDRIEFLPTVYVARHRDLLTTVSDPRVLVGGRPVSYQKNLGEATGYGLDVSLNLFPSEGLMVFVNPSYTRLTFDQDLSFRGTRLPTRGHQIVDTPEWNLRAGLLWHWRDLQVAPTLRSVGPRFGDAVHNERVDGYTTVDLMLRYRTRFGGRTLTAGLELSNLFDERHVSSINAFDDARAGSASYYPGAPFMAMLTLEVEL